MNVMVFDRPRVSRQAVLGNSLLHPEYPIEQTFRSDDPKVQRQLTEHAWQCTAAPEQAMLVADHNGLRVLGHSEAALNHVAEALRNRFGSRLRVASPLVRYAFGVPVLEPYMTVLINGPLVHLPCVGNSIAHRRGCIARVIARKVFVLEAEAPLAALLGFEAWLQELFAEDWKESYVGLWLSRYVPIDGHGPQAA